MNLTLLVFLLICFSYCFNLHFPKFSQYNPSLTSAPTIFRASWYNISPSQCGLIYRSSVATRLCSLNQMVCMASNPSCSFDRMSPAKKQPMSLSNGSRRQSFGWLSASGNNGLCLGSLIPSRSNPWLLRNSRRSCATSFEYPYTCQWVQHH